MWQNKKIKNLLLRVERIPMILIERERVHQVEIIILLKLRKVLKIIIA